ncbi:MAG: hypothetical protein Q4C60_03690 [Eubacteriales bacterium]|nr:hypothetical protein [Eubacteriales bacterium]
MRESGENKKNRDRKDGEKLQKQESAAQRREKKAQKKEDRRRAHKEFWAAFGLERRQNRTTFLVFSVLRVFVIFTMVRQFMIQNYEGFFLCILTLLLFGLPTYLQVRFRVEVPQTLEIIVMIFIFAAEILGEVSNFYTIFPFWDTILHTINGFLAAAVGFSLVLILNRNEKVMFSLSPLYLAIVAFCFSMTIGVIWEFFECSMDLLFGLDMQKDTVVHSISSILINESGAQRPVTISNITSTVVNGQELPIEGYLDIGLLDTMEDLFVNFVGALVFSVIGYFALRGGDREGDIANRFMLRRKKPEHDYLKRIQDGDKSLFAPQREESAERPAEAPTE